MPKLTDDDIESAAVEAMRNALGGPGSDVSFARVRNLQYYNAEAVGDLAPPEVEDRSDFVATDVADTIDGMLPQLLRMFISTDDAVEFESNGGDGTPQGMEYADAEAKMATAWVNHVFYVRNDGVSILHDWMKDAMQQKVGFVKAWAEEDADESKQRFDGVTQEQLVMLLQEGWQLDGEPEVDEEASQEAGMSLLNFAVKKTSRRKVIRILPIAPVAMRIDQNARWNGEPAMIGDEQYRRKFEMAEDGYDLDQIGAGNSMPTDPETLEQLGETRAFVGQTPHESHDLYRCGEVYIKLDADGDGIAEWLKVNLIEDKLATKKGKPAWEMVDGHPYEWATLIPRPHAFFGDCPADRAIEVQKLRTRTVRAIQDNMFLTVNQRTYINTGANVNMDDFLDSRPGGAVRGTMEPSKAMAPIVQPSLGAPAYQFNEYIGSWGENRTGFNRYSAGTDQNALNRTKGGVELLTSKADMRMDLMARFFAVGLKNLFSKILKLSIQHQNVIEMVKIGGKFVAINPSEFKNQFTSRIKVGLGTGSKDQQAQRVMGLLNVMQPGLALGIVGPENIANAIKLYAEANEFKNPERFVSAQPTGMPSPEQFKALQAHVEQHIAKITDQLHAMGQENQMLKVQLANKQDELAIRAQEVQLKAGQGQSVPDAPDHGEWTKLHIDASKAEEAQRIALYEAETRRRAQELAEYVAGVNLQHEAARVHLEADQQVFGQAHDAARFGLDQRAQESSDNGEAEPA